MKGEHEMQLSGFYTQELRHENARVGFDVVTLDGLTANLAKKRYDFSKIHFLQRFLKVCLNFLKEFIKRFGHQGFLR